MNFSQIIKEPEDENWKKIKFLVVSPGFFSSEQYVHPLLKLAKSHNIEIISDIDLLYNHCRNSSYIGITGTNGKSTTTALLGHIFKETGIRSQIGGNIGIAALDLEPMSNEATYILEMSSYQLDLVNKIHFNIAILLNITKDHIEHHGSFENYIRAKEKIFNHQTEHDLAIIGIDSAEGEMLYQRLSKSLKSQIIPISTKKILDQGISVIDGYIHNNHKIEAGYGRSLALGNISTLLGDHNGENIAACFAAAIKYNVLPEEIIRHITSFPGIDHRIQYAGRIGNVEFINDSKATNFDAAAKALAIFENIYWIVGGIAKDGEFDQIIPYLSKIRHIFIIGRDQDVFIDIAQRFDIAYSKCDILEKSVHEAYRLASTDQNEAVILLSPACSSLDQWKNFEERGEYFLKYVQDISSKS